MEVHHPTRHTSKKLKDYFFEFLMLFLAVAAGFFAENLREHRLESKREREMMQALLQDLKADIYQIDSLKVRRVSRNADADSLINLLSSSSANASPERKILIYFWGRNASRRIHFRPQDGILQQLKNAGGFRVVHDSSVSNSINAYELALKLNQENIEVEEKELTAYADVAAKIFDVKVFQEMTQGDSIVRPSGNPALISYEPKLINELCIKLHYWKRTSLTVLDSFDKLEGNARKLMGLLKEEYGLR